VSRGFTLVEVMVALAVMSLVMLTTVTGFRTLGNTAGTLNTVTARVDELRSVSTFLRDALENAVVGTESTGGGLTLGGMAEELPMSAYFRINEGGVEWASQVLFGESFGGSHFLRLANVDNALVLLWQEPGGNLEPDDWDDASRRVVLDNLEELRISYRRSFDEDWRDDQPLLEAPALVRLQIRADGRFWPDLVMRVQR